MKILCISRSLGISTPGIVIQHKKGNVFPLKEGIQD